MNKILVLCITFLVSTNVMYSMSPVYSAQASGNYDPNAYNQGGENQNNIPSNQQNQNNGQNYLPTQNNQGNYQQYGQAGGYSNNQNNNQTSNANNNLPNNNQGNPNQASSNQNGFGNNNNQSNTAPSEYNNQPANSQNGNNQPINNVQNSNQQNIFTENYARKGMYFKATVYKRDRSNRLYKTTLNSSDLQKAIVIFFGDWCPHCSRFLGNFSKNMPMLMQAGVRIIFIAVPSINRLQNWQEPTDTDFNEHLQKLNSFGIQLGNNSELVLLGDKTSLNNNAVDSLPTMMAISNSMECFRGGADNSIEKVEFASQDSLNQFLQVFNSFGNAQNYNNANKTIINNIPRHIKNNNSKNYYHVKVNVERTNMFTEMLNSGCDYSCVLKNYTLPRVTHYRFPSYRQCPPCPACPVCPQCSTPIPAQSHHKTVDNENYSNTPEVIPETCTTCGCILKRAFSRKCNTTHKKKRCQTKRCCKRH